MAPQWVLRGRHIHGKDGRGNQGCGTCLISHSLHRVVIPAAVALVHAGWRGVHRVLAIIANAAIADAVWIVVVLFLLLWLRIVLRLGRWWLRRISQLAHARLYFVDKAQVLVVVDEAGFRLVESTQRGIAQR